MAIRKTTAVLSLAVLASFGLSGCEGSFNISGGSDTTQAPSSSPSVSAIETSSKETEEVRAQAETTLNDIKALSESDEFKAFYDELNAVADEGPESMSKIEAVIDKHQPLQDKLQEKIVLSPEALKGYQGIYAMSSANMEVPFTEKVMNASIYYSAMADVIVLDDNYKNFTSFGVTSNAVTEKDGEYKLDTFGIYAKDNNGAIIDFPDTTFSSYGLEDGGTKIVIENVDGEMRDDKSSVSSSDQVEIDVKNAATRIESWIVSQKGERVPLVVEDGRIISGELNPKGNQDIKTSDGIELEFEGDSYDYVITGTDTKTGAVVAYESAKGGLRTVSEGTSKEDTDSVKYDFTAFDKFENSASNEYYEDLSAYVEYLNSDQYVSDAEFEVVTKNGVEYVKVNDSNTKVTDDELLYVSPLS